MSTRDDLTTYTSDRALSEQRASDGGLYIPYRIPKLSDEELRRVREMDTKEIVMFVARRYLRLPDGFLEADGIPVRINAVGNRIAVCDIFPERCGSFRGYTNMVADCLCPDGQGNTGLLSVCLRIGAIAAAITAYDRLDEMHTNCRTDITAVAGDLFGPMSAFIAREMGFPVGDILCCCNENSGFWELLHHGAFRTDQVAAHTGIPEADIAVPDGLECLIALCCGREEVARYLEAVRSGRPYMPGEEGLEGLRSAFRATVVTDLRHILGAYISRGIPIRAGTALALTGLMNYRTGNGPARRTLVLAE